MPLVGIIAKKIDIKARKKEMQIISQEDKKIYNNLAVFIIKELHNV